MAWSPLVSSINVVTETGTWMVFTTSLQLRVACARSEIMAGIAVDTFSRVSHILARYLSIPAEDVREDSRLEEDLGLDSLGALEVIFEIEEEFKIKVPDERLDAFPTVRAVCDRIEALQAAPSSVP